MNYAESLAFYAAVFAADAGTDALYYERYTEDMAHLCVTVAKEAIRRSDMASGDFYTLAFVEEAARTLGQCHTATLAQMLDAGQRESDSIAGKGEA